MASDWWLDRIKSELSQGDVLTNVPISSLTNPPQFLAGAALGKGVSGKGWVETPQIKTDGDGLGHALARARIGTVIVISHDCEIDKKDAQPVVVAVLRSTDTLNGAERSKVMTQRSLRAMPLPDVPKLGEHYVDLRFMCSMPKGVLMKCDRVASMTDEAVLRLQAQVLGFVCRLDPEALKQVLSSRLS